MVFPETRDRRRRRITVVLFRLSSVLADVPVLAVVLLLLLLMLLPVLEVLLLLLLPGRSLPLRGERGLLGRGLSSAK